MRKDEDATPCLSKVPNYTVRDGIIYVTSGDWSCCMPLRIFKLAQLKADKAIAEYEAKSAEIVPIKGHAASSRG